MKITLEPGAVFDILSIISIKLDEAEDPQDKIRLTNQLSALMHEVQEQIGVKKLNSVLDSREYSSLYFANFTVFEEIAAVRNKKSNISSLEMDNKNYKRYLAKSKLQKKHFKENIKEVKLGY